MTNTKKIVIASLLAMGIASSASASETFLAPNASLFNQPASQQQRVVSGHQAYAFAPLTQNAAGNNAESREFNRVDADTVSSH